MMNQTRQRSNAFVLNLPEVLHTEQQAIAFLIAATNVSSPLVFRNMNNDNNNFITPPQSPSNKDSDSVNRISPKRF